MILHQNKLIDKNCQQTPLFSPDLLFVLKVQKKFPVSGRDDLMKAFDFYLFLFSDISAMVFSQISAVGS